MHGAGLLTPAYYFAALPVPDNETSCGAPDSSSLMVNCPLCGVVSAGLKITQTLQLLPGANDSMHSVVTEKGAAADSPVIDTLSADFLELPFLIVTTLALLTEPTTVDSPKLTELGEISNLASTGVGVAVGVAVLVAVAVAVAVGVALVAVAVGVGVPPVAVAVGVGPVPNAFTRL